MEVNFDRFKRGKGVWRHDDSFLNDANYLSEIKKSISHTLAKYLHHNQYDNFFVEANEAALQEFENLSPQDKNNLEYKINPNLLLEMVLNDIKNHSSAYAAAKKREHRNILRDKLIDLTWLKKLQSGDRPPLNINTRVDQCETEYNSLLDDHTRKSYLSKRIRAAVEGEKATPYFLNSQKNQSAMKYISKLTITTNCGVEKTITKQAEIENEIKHFYSSLYKERQNTISSIDGFFENDPINMPSITDKDREFLNEEITMNEVYAALRSSNNKSAPGSTGFSYLFFKVFWTDLSFIILNCYRYSLQTRKLPVSLSRGIISLIPKGNKPKDRLDNWRPITLLDVLYKVLSKTIANRINRVLPSIIHPDQCGFVKGRYIGECVRTTMDVLDHAKQKQKTGLLLLIDFKKAFDSISFSFIKKNSSQISLWGKYGRLDRDIATKL